MVPEGTHLWHSPTAFPSTGVSARRQLSLLLGHCGLSSGGPGWHESIRATQHGGSRAPLAEILPAARPETRFRALHKIPQQLSRQLSRGASAHTRCTHTRSECIHSRCTQTRRGAPQKSLPQSSPELPQSSSGKPLREARHTASQSSHRARQGSFSEKLPTLLPRAPTELSREAPQKSPPHRFSPAQLPRAPGELSREAPQRSFPHSFPELPQSPSGQLLGEAPRTPSQSSHRPLQENLAEKLPAQLPRAVTELLPGKLLGEAPHTAPQSFQRALQGSSSEKLPA